MDYDVINAAIADIVLISKRYCESNGYDESLFERLVIALLGFYLTFGPEIFKKINVVLDSLKIYQCDAEEECIQIKKSICQSDLNPSLNPGTMWDYKYDCYSGNFIGAIPKIVYLKLDTITDALSLAHELSHVLEGVTAKKIYEDNNSFNLLRGFSKVGIRKIDNATLIESHGMTELITVTIENKILNSLSKLDVDQIINPMIKGFISELKKTKEKNIMTSGYVMMAAAFKDLIDNYCFFDLIKKYYYETQQEEFIEEFNNFDKNLNFQTLIKYADELFFSDFDYNEVMYYAPYIQKQIDIFSKTTGFKPDKRIIVLV